MIAITHSKFGSYSELSAGVLSGTPALFVVQDPSSKAETKTEEETKRNE